MIISYLSLSVLIFFTYIAIAGYGKFFISILNLQNSILEEFKLIEFIFGLILLGIIGILFNFFYAITDFFSIVLIAFGIIFFIIFFLKIKNKIHYIYFVVLLVFVSTFFSFYSLLNDDFGYHFKTIVNFKKYTLFNIPHNFYGSHNSHWLFLNSLFYITSYPKSLYCITSLFYSVTIFDFFQSYKRNLLNNNHIATSYSFFILFFLLGVLNYYKEYGTDFPGQILILFLFIVYFEQRKLFKKNQNLEIYFILILISFFAFIIKITNILIFLIILDMFLISKKKLKTFLLILICSLPTCLWFLQNYFISTCLIYPISITCFEEYADAKVAMFNIESFAKTVLEGGYSTSTVGLMIKNYSWIPVWFVGHFPKILETYSIYFLLLIFPFVIFKLRHAAVINKNQLFKISYHNVYFIFSLITIVSNIVWFLNAPAYRFGIAYNLNLLAIILLPIWVYILSNNRNFFLFSTKFLLIISLFVFIYINIIKTTKFIDRYGYAWPNVLNNHYLEKID